VAALLVVTLSSCAKGEPAPRNDEERLARAQVLIDSGNEAYRAGDYRLAAKRYAAAAVVKKDDPAAYFGMGMALSKLGRHDEAHAAYERSHELAQTKKKK
jgi:Flp pilus assembly protein TadD